jgi:fido (protein-threonine AMPylation protein)
MDSFPWNFRRFFANKEKTQSIVPDAVPESLLPDKDKQVSDKRELFLSTSHGDLTRQELELMIAHHPDDYEAVCGIYEQIWDQVKVLDEPYFAACVKAIKNWDNFSPVDGEWLRTPEEKLAYINKLLNLSLLEKQWYESTAKHIPATQFVSTGVIPSYLQEEEKNYDEMAKTIHSFLLRGTYAQRQMLSDEQFNMAGHYRNQDVFVNIYRAPKPEKLPLFMEKYSQQLKNFMAQLESMRNELGGEFEERVLELAVFALHRLTDIHPFADGNGRVARALYEYIVVKFLGADNKYKNPTLYGKMPVVLKLRQEPMSRDLTFGVTRLAKDLEGKQYFGQDLLERHLDDRDIWAEVFNDKNIKSFVRHLKEVKDTGRERYPIDGD